MKPGYIDFEFNLPRGLLVNLVEDLEKAETARLTVHDLEKIPQVQGVYQLFLDNLLVYIGKTDAHDGLKERLDRHREHIQHRLHLNPKCVSFKAARVRVFTAVDLESLLIDHYEQQSDDKDEGRILAWQHSGFGSNDPGRRRDTTEVSERSFDWQYPIDIDREIELDLTAANTAAEVLTTLKQHLPYVFRFQRSEGGSTRPHKDLETTEVTTVLQHPPSARSIISQVVGELQRGWLATKLLGYIILYKNDNNTYSQGEEIARSPETMLTE